MLRRFFKEEEEETPVDKQIDAVLSEMSAEGVDSDKYPKLMGYLERLTKLKQNEKLPPVSRDTIALIAGNLLGILLIVAYEQKHVMTSKGFNQIIRPGKP